MSNIRKSNTTSILDFLFILLFGFIVLYMMSVPKTPIKKNDIVEKAEFMIEISWDNFSTDDVDTFFVTAEGEKIFFKHKQVGVYNLDRDDMGTSTDEIVQPDGSKKIININREVLTMRGYSAGEYNLSVFMYSKRSLDPAKVHAKIYKLNPFSIIVDREVVLYQGGDEATIANFTLNASGEVVELNYDDKPLIGEIGILGPTSGPQ